MAKEKKNAYIPAPLDASIMPAPRWTRTLIDGRAARLFARESHANRESWATSLVDHYRARFAALGSPIPARVRVGIGFPRGSRGTGRSAIGMAYHPAMSADRAAEVTVAPTLADPVEVAQVVLHELAHHAAGCEHGHKAPFGRLARALGCEGRLTATVAGPEMIAELAPLLDLMGPYPHGRLRTSGRKKAATRLVKCECPSCGYVLRTTRKWIDEVGLPVCPCGEEFEEVTK